MRIFYKSFIFLLSFVPLKALQAQDSIPANHVEKISLKINLEPNTSYRFVSSNTQKTVQKLMEMELETHLNSTVHYRFEVEDNTGKEMRIKASYERIELNIQALQDTISIDTDKQEGEQTSEYFTLLSSLINKPFYIVLSNKGKILKLEGLAEDLSIIEMEKTPHFEKTINSQSLLSDIESNFYIFPEDSISLGQSWHRDEEQRINSQSALSLKKLFTLESLSEDMAWVNIEHQIENESLKTSLETDIKVSGTLQGLIELDRNTGLILFSETQQEIEANIQMLGIEHLLKVTSSNTLNGRKL